MSLKRKKKTTRKARQQPKTSYTVPVRVFLICTAVAVVLISCWLLLLQVRGKFFNNNSHYIIKNIDIVNIDKKQLSRYEILEYLKGDSPLAENEPPADDIILLDKSNLHAIDVEKIRLRFEKHPLIESAQVYRRVPDTVCIEFYERSPIAKIHVKGKKWYVDENEFLFEEQPSFKKENLPFIIGVRDSSGFENHKKIENDDFLAAAVKFIKIMTTHKENKYFDIKFIRLDYSQYYPRIVVILNKKYTFRQDAQIIIPTKDMEKAINERLIRIVKERTAANQPTLKIDITYEKNTPVTP